VLTSGYEEAAGLPWPELTDDLTVNQDEVPHQQVLEDRATGDLDGSAWVGHSSTFASAPAFWGSESDTMLRCSFVRL
jgi:hypothetical protein